MASKRWSVAVTDLTGSAHLHDVAVEADNWMSALRAGRTRIGEEGGVPQGASCAVSPDGVVTILDPISRRRFVLTQRIAGVPEGSAPVEPQASVPAAAAPSTPSGSPPTTAPVDEAATGKRRKFQTVAFDASTLLASPPSAAIAAAPRAVPPSQVPVSAPPSPVPVPAAAVTPASVHNAPATGGRRKFQTVAFDTSTVVLPPLQAASQPTATITAPAAVATPASRQPEASVVIDPSVMEASSPAATATPTFSAPKPPPQAVMPSAAPPAMPSARRLHERAEDPTPKNPLTYRERSFVIAAGTTRAEAETVLRAELAVVQAEIQAAKRGKFVNLALFDHHWQSRPERPPIATLQWKDWKGDPEIAFPVPPQRPVSQPPPAANDDRLASAFEALQDLPFLNSAAEGLEFAVKLLSDLIPSQAISACLYDINTDELRIVAAMGPGASERKTQAIPVAMGLFGNAARGGDKALVVHDAPRHPDFDAAFDVAPGIDARTMLLRPLVQEGQLFGVVQLTNKTGGAPYTAEDVNLINYIAERVADFVRQARLRGRN